MKDQVWTTWRENMTMLLFPLCSVSVSFFITVLCIHTKCCTLLPNDSPLWHSLGGIRDTLQRSQWSRWWQSFCHNKRHLPQRHCPMRCRKKLPTGHWWNTLRWVDTWTHMQAPHKDLSSTRETQGQMVKKDLMLRSSRFSFCWRQT